jgi:hypothetical protein
LDEKIDGVESIWSEATYTEYQLKESSRSDLLRLRHGVTRRHGIRHGSTQQSFNKKGSEVERNAQYNMAPLAGKKVLVIGGSSGVGFAVAKAALAEGAHVIIASSTAGKLEAAAARLDGGERVQSHVVDVGAEESFEALFAKTGPVAHLVYTVGACTRRRHPAKTRFRPAARFRAAHPLCSRTSSCPAQRPSSTGGTGVCVPPAPPSPHVLIRLAQAP